MEVPVYDAHGWISGALIEKIQTDAPQGHTNNLEQPEVITSGILDLQYGPVHVDTPKMFSEENIPNFFTEQ